MPFCPRCRTEYVAGCEECSDCGELLVDELPQSEHQRQRKKSVNDILSNLKYVFSTLKRNRMLYLIPFIIIDLNILIVFPVLRAEYRFLQPISGQFTQVPLFHPNLNMVLSSISTSISYVGGIAVFPDFNFIVSIMVHNHYLENILYNIESAHPIVDLLMSFFNLYWAVLLAGILALARAALLGEPVNRRQFLSGIRRYTMPLILIGMIALVVRFLFNQGLSIVYNPATENKLLIIISINQMVIGCVVLIEHLAMIAVVAGDLTVHDLKKIKSLVFNKAHTMILLFAWLWLFIVFFVQHYLLWNIMVISSPSLFTLTQLIQFTYRFFIDALLFLVIMMIMKSMLDVVAKMKESSPEPITG